MVIGEGITLSGMQVVGPLWENASPTSAFSAQNLSIDVGKYDFLLVAVLHWTDNQTRSWHIVSLFDNIWNILSAPNRTGASPYRRIGTNTAKTTIFFEDCYNSGSVNNRGCIPIYIYGVKGVASV